MFGVSLKDFGSLAYFLVIARECVVDEGTDVVGSQSREIDVGDLHC